MADQVWAGCTVADDLWYDVDQHVWVRLEDDHAVLGMTDVAQTMGGRMVQLTFRRLGRSYPRGRSLAIVESAKWVGPFPTPLTGELVEVNEEGFAADIAIANRDPYGAGWIARIRPTRLAEERMHLIDARTAFERYKALIQERGIHCYRCAD